MEVTYVYGIKEDNQFKMMLCKKEFVEEYKKNQFEGYQTKCFDEDMTENEWKFICSMFMRHGVGFCKLEEIQAVIV